MFTLMMGGGYPVIMWVYAAHRAARCVADCSCGRYPALEYSKWTAWYFVSFILVTTYFISTIVVAVLMRFYKRHRQKSVIYDRWKERRWMGASELVALLWRCSL